MSMQLDMSLAVGHTFSDMDSILGDDISFNGVDGLSAPKFLQAIRKRAFTEDRVDDPKYMVAIALFALAEPALEWFERQSDEVQTDWTRFRSALLEQFSTPAPNQRGRRHSAYSKYVS